MDQINDISIQKRKRRRGPNRIILLILAVILLAGIVTAVVLLNRPAQEEENVTEPDSGTYCSYDTDQVASLTVTLRSGETWTLLQSEDGTCTLAGDPDFRVSSSVAENLMYDAATVTWTEVLSADPEEFSGRLSEFGLDTPKAKVEITYRDGKTVTLLIGEASGIPDDSFYYMTISGDDRLLALDVTTAEDYAVERALLHAVVQPTIHSARIDSIVFRKADGTVTSWELNAAITDGDAADRWLLTSPIRYPADGDSISNLKKNLSNFRLGAYVGEANEENLEKYGFSGGCFTMTIHMAEGYLASTSTDSDGEAQATYWPESTVTVQVGGAKSDMVDYVLYEEEIFITSHFSLNVFMSINAADTLTRYPVLTTLSNLKSLTVEKDGETTVYTVTRTEQVAENNDLVYDDDGNIVYDVTVKKNGKEISWDSFESAYNVLLMVTVSGTLPEGWTQTKDAHTTYTFETETGVTHTIALTDFDAMHDAVLVDGCAAFYLVKGGMDFLVEE